MIVFDSDPSPRVNTTRALVERVGKHNLKLPASNARLAAVDENFLGHTILPASEHSKVETASALTLIPMPLNLKQIRSLLGGGFVLQKVLARYVQTNSTNQFLFTPAMKPIVRDVDFAAPPVLVFSGWDALEEGSLPIPGVLRRHYRWVWCCA